MKNIISYNERLKYYLGNIINETYITNENLFTIEEHKKMYSSNKICLNKYILNFNKLLKKYNYKNKIFLITPGDIEIKQKNYCFVKNRTTDDKKSIIIRCMNKDRHWKNYYDKPKDIIYDKKINKIFWRGTTTGKEHNKGNRFELVKKWFNKNNNIDIGFSFL